MEKNQIIETLKIIETNAQANLAAVRALIKQLEADESTIVMPKTMTIKDARLYAILNAVYENGGELHVDKISELLEKYCYDYHAFNANYGKPMSKMQENNSMRGLTEIGKKAVEDFNREYGENWLEKINRQILTNPQAKDMLIQVDVD